MSRSKTIPRPLRYAAIVSACAMLTATLVSQPAIGVGSAHTDTAPPTPCAPPTAPGPPPLTPTTATTIEQAYYCVFAHYYNAAALDDRPLLDGAFAGLTQSLDHLGIDQPDATAPALTGNREQDWTAFAAIYQQIVDQLPTDPNLRQQVASATMQGMIAALDDNHAGWSRPVMPPGFQPGDQYGIGLVTSPTGPLLSGAPAEARPPLFVSAVLGGPAAAQGLRPGDVIDSVDGQAPFVDGVPSPGVEALLDQRYPQSDRVQLKVHRPADGRSWTVTLKPELYPMSAAANQPVSASLLSDHIADVQLHSFLPGAADTVLADVARMRAGGTLNGLVLDLRGNGGGDVEEVSRLLGAFKHQGIWSFDCDSPDTCDIPHRTDDTVPLLGIPLVVLTDRGCASACDAFSGAVKDLRLGRIVGTRTAGVVAGPAAGFVLDDGSFLGLPAGHELGADHEMLNGIGVAPDDYQLTTPADLSTGHDHVLAEAVRLLGH
ncbi:peptidase S41 [Catenulispora acidiphila DSM 44928]|uniref:Peptidase S41 n=1 Tax=Catenulispora acidiphila (strain DSM 44928 / JCM 14897 / NBRC 102108 / NRRL B-24433 / ID139908) TaxID=479433 RepID=C7Q000_CATAD|nr:S41 family peptidase [Catenulispora acidiphila]ACU75493.1 peptidase S41 [Catenulispora acidiphila DSM 44928]